MPKISEEIVFHLLTGGLACYDGGPIAPKPYSGATTVHIVIPDDLLTAHYLNMQGLGAISKDTIAKRSGGIINILCSDHIQY